MSDELLYAEPVHPETVESLNSRFSPMNTFMFAGSPDRLEVGTWLVTFEVRAQDPFEPGWTRQKAWHWNLTTEQIKTKYEMNDLFNQGRRYILIPK